MERTACKKLFSFGAFQCLSVPGYYLPMPTIIFRGKQIECVHGETLRAVLLRHQESPHNGKAQWLNCRGMGTCGTCAVEIEGPVNPKTPMENWRLNFPPHKQPTPLRLACQVKVLGDLLVRKHEGFWGEKYELPK